MALSFTWFGHSTFLFVTPGRKRILVDPWIATNPSCPDSSKKISELDLMLITHGHDDHISDAVPIARATLARVIAPFELAAWLERKGLQAVTGMNYGGTLRVSGLAVTMVPAVHSSSVEDEGRHLYAGNPCGYVIRFEDGLTIYFAGDTAIFGDMRLIGELHRPELAFLPIGDTYTMGPEDAAKACELLGVRQVVPMHYRTFPTLTGTPDRLRAALAGKNVDVLELKPGETTT